MSGEIKDEDVRCELCVCVWKTSAVIKCIYTSAFVHIHCRIAIVSSLHIECIGKKNCCCYFFLSQFFFGLGIVIAGECAPLLIHFLLVSNKYYLCEFRVCVRACVR